MKDLREVPLAKQQEAILRVMIEDGSITTMECFQKLGITTLAERVSELRKKGFQFEQKWETNQNGKRYIRYSLI